MRQSDYNVKTGINSEIHASLRRLEDADYISEQVMMDNLTVLTDHVDEIDQRLTAAVNDLENEIKAIYNYITPHLKDDDLSLFQNIWVGNLAVDTQATITGNVSITDHGRLTVDGLITASRGITIENGNITMPDSNKYSYHTFSIEGDALDGYILATKDLSFSLVGLVEGFPSGATYLVRTKKNQILLGSVTVQPVVRYDSTNNIFYAKAKLTDNNGLESETLEASQQGPPPAKVTDLEVTVRSGQTLTYYAPSAGYDGYDYVEVHGTGGSSGGGGGDTCFAAGTPITMADGSEVPIECLTLGSVVKSYDTETEQFIISEVYSVQAYHNAQSVYDLHIACGRIVTVSDSHPILTRGGWKSLNPEQSFKEMRSKKFELSPLTEEDEVLTIDGYKALDRIVQREDLTGCTMYNIDVEEVDTFVAGGIVAHNMDPKYN